MFAHGMRQVVETEGEEDCAWRGRVGQGEVSREVVNRPLLQVVRSEIGC